MKQADNIRRFVQTTLGCGCPEEVFRSIDVARKVPLNSFITLIARIIIGNRLLIYIADAGSAGCVEEHLPVLLNAGRKERDRKGLNRFRLVLAAEEPGSAEDIAERLFEELREKDEKVHLHVIPKSEVLFTTLPTLPPSRPPASPPSDTLPRTHMQSSLPSLFRTPLSPRGS